MVLPAAVVAFGLESLCRCFSGQSMHSLRWSVYHRSTHMFKVSDSSCFSQVASPAAQSLRPAPGTRPYASCPSATPLVPPLPPPHSPQTHRRTLSPSLPARYQVPRTWPPAYGPTSASCRSRTSRTTVTPAGFLVGRFSSFRGTDVVGLPDFVGR